VVEASEKVEFELSEQDRALVDGLRRRDESSFVTLVQLYQSSLTRLARLFVADQATAEDVVQETWIGVLQGIDRFEGRASLRTWIFRILVNRARRRGERDSRMLPFSTAWTAADESDEAAVDPTRFLSEGIYKGHWSSFPMSWDELPEERILSAETRQRVEDAIADLPPSQREVITLRDIEGWSSPEVCNALSISETNQRVLLHRARSKVRRALEEYLA
jgi:RNA polymerase sigma-70 factor, ECF subfamily